MNELLAQNEFTTAEIEDFISNALVIKCPKRTILLREGETQRFFYWLTKGIFRAGYTDKKGNDITRAFFTPDTVPFVVAYGCLMAQCPSLSFLEAIEDSEVMSWRFDYIKMLEDTDVKWLRFLKKQVDNVFLQRDIKEWQFYTLSSEELYLAFVEQSPELVNTIPQHYIASYLGISPEALSRIKSRLSTKKIDKMK